MKNSEKQYAIVDIETTGGNAKWSRITEIAILIHNGEHVIDRWSSLVNPQQEIPPAIFALTGITNQMVADAPLFVEIAEKVHALLAGRIFVAHNVNFDYSFVRHQLEEAGVKWSAQKLCTVRMARKVIPGYPSYSLGKLCNSLAIPIANRHRATGDAEATALLFDLLISSDREQIIPKMIAKISSDQRLPPNLAKEEFDNLPSCIGIYFFHDRSGKVIYVGKAVDIKKRVSAHFSGHNINAQRQHFLRDICHISYEQCGTELIALLRECEEIQALWPIYNRALKRYEPKFGLFTYQGQNDYQYLCIGRIGKHQKCIQVFSREYDGIRMVQKLAADFGIDRRYCRFGSASVSTPVVHTDEISPLPDVGEHNAAIEQALDYLLDTQPTFYILDHGRHVEEKSCIWVEKGQVYGLGYMDLSMDCSQPQDMRDTLDRLKSNHYMMQLVLDYGRRYPQKVNEIQKITA